MARWQRPGSHPSQEKTDVHSRGPALSGGRDPGLWDLMEFRSGGWAWVPSKATCPTRPATLARSCKDKTLEIDVQTTAVFGEESKGRRRGTKIQKDSAMFCQSEKKASTELPHQAWRRSEDRAWSSGGGEGASDRQSVPLGTWDYDSVRTLLCDRQPS